MAATKKITRPAKKSGAKKKPATVGQAKMDVYRAVRHGTKEQVAAAHAKLRAAEARADKGRGWAAIQNAIEAGKADTLATLLAKTSPDIASSFGLTALGCAVSEGHLECVRVLLDAGAAVDKPAFEGDTALSMAAHHGRADIIELLLARGANPTVKNPLNETPADRAKKAGHAALAKRLR